ncbi:hypothetical protein FO519_005737 [Halicephalobus sp. NKZ332]|nr:hypothetical protein FO519_005737 [Halicephalobus sp. NKZ332]
MLRRLGAVGIPAVAGVVGGYYYRDDLRVFAATLVDSSASSISSPSRSSAYFDDSFSRIPWDYNWDQRDPFSLIDHSVYDKADEETRKKMVEKVTPTATRHIILIRHGQYVMNKDDPTEKKLTLLGREQASLLGKRLAESGINFTSLTMSTMTRAMETAGLILEKMPALKSKSDSILEEGAPYPPEPDAVHWRPSKKKFFSEGARIEAAFRKYIHRASPTQKEDSWELVVCHANVIRYFICRALQFPPEGWLRMSLANCSITWITVRPNGNVSIRAVGDAGHISQNKISFN